MARSVENNVPEPVTVAELIEVVIVPDLLTTMVIVPDFVRADVIFPVLRVPGEVESVTPGVSDTVLDGSTTYGELLP